MAATTSIPRNIAPAHSGDSTRMTRPVDGVHGREFEPDGVRKRRKLTAVACSTCQRRKCKCDGERPTCHACRVRSLDCSYDVADNITSRRSALKQQNAELNGAMGGMNALVDKLRLGTDKESSKILARMRVGENMDDIIREIEDEGGGQLQPLEAEGPGTPSLDLTLSGGIQTSPKQELFASIFPDHQDLNPATFNLIDIPGTLENYMTRADDLLLWPASAVDCSPFFDRMTWSAWMPKRAAGQLNQAGADLGPLRSGSTLENPASIRSDDGGLGDWQTFSQSNIDPASSAALPPSESDSASQAEGFRQRLSAAEPKHQHGVSVAPNAHDRSGNLPFSDEVQDTIRPSHGPSRSAGNMMAPHWAMMSVCQSEDGTPTHAFNTFYMNTLDAIRTGVPVAQIVGPHPFIAALFDREKFAKAPELSKWAARMVRSIKSTAAPTSAADKGAGSTDERAKPDVTHCALMYLFWLLMRWMLEPCASHYSAIPRWLRPTPDQLFKPHPMVMDFLVWPKVRELRGEAVRDLGWLLQVCMTVTVNWPKDRGSGLEGAVCIDGESGELDLNPVAKDHLFTLDNWSVAPSVRRYLPNADEMLKVRAEE